MIPELTGMTLQVGTFHYTRTKTHGLGSDHRKNRGPFDDVWGNVELRWVHKNLSELKVDPFGGGGRSWLLSVLVFIIYYKTS